MHDGGTRNAPVIRALCNEGAEVEVLSTGRELLVHFFAKSNIPGHGFKATFQFQGLHGWLIHIINDYVCNLC